MTDLKCLENVVQAALVLFVPQQTQPTLSIRQPAVCHAIAEKLYPVPHALHKVTLASIREVRKVI